MLSQLVLTLCARIYIMITYSSMSVGYAQYDRTIIGFLKVREDLLRPEHHRGPTTKNSIGPKEFSESNLYFCGLRVAPILDSLPRLVGSQVLLTFINLNKT